MGNDHMEHHDLVEYSREGHVGTITLNRPDKRNALNLALWEALDAAVKMAGQDKECRVILVRGEGRSFCAGLDLSPDNDVIHAIMEQPGASQKIRFYQLVRRLQEIHTRLERVSQPTIAVIHGHCLGAGLELVLCCDIRLCSADALFALPEARLAIITDVGGLQRLPRVVGEGHAREMAFRGHQISADRANAIGLVNEVYPDKEILDQKAAEMAADIASNPPLAVQGAKEVFLYNHEVSPDEAMDYNAARSSMIIPSQDLLEAVSAYQQKRAGNFKGA